MRRRLSSLHPSFLKSLDQYLLINHPIIWASRIHFVLFYAGISMLAIGMICQLPISAGSRPDVDKQVLLVSIPVLITGLFWLREVAAFRIDRLFGPLSLRNRVAYQGLILLGIGVWTLIPLIYGQGKAYQTAHSEIGLEGANPSSYTSCMAWNYSEAWEQQAWDFQAWFFCIIPSDSPDSHRCRNSFTLLAFLIVLIWQMSMLYLRLGIRQFMQFLLVGLIFLTLMASMNFLLESLVSGGTDSALFFTYFFWMGMLISPSYAKDTKMGSPVLRRIKLSLAAMLTPFALIVIQQSWEDILPGDLGYVTLLGGTVVSLFSWIYFYEPRFLDLQAEPRAK